MDAVRLSVSAGLKLGNDFVKELDDQAEHRIFVGTGIQQFVTHDPGPRNRHTNWIVGSLEFSYLEHEHNRVEGCNILRLFLEQIRDLHCTTLRVRLILLILRLRVRLPSLIGRPMRFDFDGLSAPPADGDSGRPDIVNREVAKAAFESFAPTMLPNAF